jgi:hypothetical protein
VVRRGYVGGVGGGYASFDNNLTSWAYSPSRGSVTTALVYFYGHNFSSARLAQVKECVRQSLGLGPAGALRGVIQE